MWVLREDIRVCLDVSVVLIYIIYYKALVTLVLTPVRSFTFSEYIGIGVDNVRNSSIKRW